MIFGAKKIKVGCCAMMKQFRRLVKQGYGPEIMLDTSIFILIGDFLKIHMSSAMSAL